MEKQQSQPFLSASDSHNFGRYVLASGPWGGKTQGLVAAFQLLKNELPPMLNNFLSVPTSYFVGTDEFDQFLEANQLSANHHISSITDSKYGELVTVFESASLSTQLSSKLENMLKEIGETAFIIRSSSLLEDQSGASFAGIYQSVFCPNQGTLDIRLAQLETGIKQVYASTYSPNALAYRRQMNLIGEVEKMALLIQVVDGQQFKQYYFPTAGGVAYSQNPYCWTERLSPKDGFVRMVWGFGSQAVSPRDDNFPRLIGLTNPRLRPERAGDNLSFYSQRYADVIDLEQNLFRTIKVESTFLRDYPALFYIASQEDGGDVLEGRNNTQLEDNLSISFAGLIEHTQFTALIKQSLAILAKHWEQDVSIEFSLNIDARGNLSFNLLQCRPMSWGGNGENSATFEEIEQKNVVLATDRFLASNKASEIRNIIYVDPEMYAQLSSGERHHKIAAGISTLNKHFASEGYLLIGPGRFGSVTPTSGIPVRFSDIYNAQVLVEIHNEPRDIFSSTYGTHFFMDLVEMDIALLAINLNQEKNFIDFDYFNSTNTKAQNDGLRIHRLSGGEKIVLKTSLSAREAFAYVDKEVDCSSIRNLDRDQT